ncbi:BspA family leucine-rich repeat surface protein [Lactiplantibacillus carotarum]|uniref:BspA family leucine-rich repeat surface protein n=1 Tax=Lactiplantibacillus carotarum TaxID=2993456 RepID=UPI00298F10CB|nr:BspA family leucine-rich repeat surface protein [Lactiplantibacillus carotarum]
MSQSDPKVHYKMYKKGRFWLFASVAVLTIQSQGLIGRAATDESTDTSASVGSLITSSLSTAKQVTLSSSTISQTDSDSDVDASATEQTDVKTTGSETAVTTAKETKTTGSGLTASSTESTNENVTASSTTTSSSSITSSDAEQSSTSSATTESTASSSSETDADSNTSKVTTATSSTSPTTTNSDASSGAGSENSAATSESVTTGSATTSSSSDLTSAGLTSESQTTTSPTDPTTTPASGTSTGADSNTDEAVDTETTNATLQPVAENVDLTSNLDTTSVNTVIPASISTSEQSVTNARALLMSASAKAADISGTFGTSNWYIDATGVLHIGEGTFATTNGKSPWGNYADQITSVSFDGAVVADSNSSYLFSGLSNVTTIDNATNLDTQAVTDMSGMFLSDNALTTVDVSNWNTSNVTTMYDMFDADQALTGLDVSKWDTSQVTNMQYMFWGNGSLTTLDVSNWQTGNVTNMASMFTIVKSLTTLDVSNWDTSKVTTMYDMFDGDNNLSELNVSNWQTGNVTNMQYLFWGNQKLTTLDVSHWDTSNVTNMANMFQGTIGLSGLDVANWNTGNVTNMSYMFSYSNVSSLDVSKWDTSHVISMDYLFDSDYNLESVDVSNWDTSAATTMKSMFYNDAKLTSVNVANFDVSHVTDTSYMFYGDTSLTTIPVGKWDTSSVTAMQSMFYGDTGLTELDVANFDVSGVTNTSYMFYGDTGLTTIPVGKWDTSSVTTMQSMFYGDTGLTDLDVANWDTSQVTDLSYVFFQDTALKTLSLSNWDTSKVTTMQSMFYQDGALVGLDLSNFDFSSLTAYIRILRETTNLQTIRIGTNTNSSITDATQLPDITANSEYTGKWVGLNTGAVYTSAQLLKSAPADTYVWQKTSDASTLNLTDTHFVVFQTAPDAWTPEVAFADATDVDGSALTWNQISVGGKIDPTKSGTYSLVYSYTDSLGNLVSQLVTVDYTASQVSIDAEDQQVNQGTTWDAAKGFERATDFDGNTVDYASVTVTGDVNTQVPGEYQVTYSYTDQHGNPATKTTTVTVVASQVAINASDQQVNQGATWDAANGFESATDFDGNAVDYADVTVTGDVNTKVPGTYEVTYSYTDQYGNAATKTTTVRLVASQVAVNASDQQVNQGATFDAANGFESATDFDGNAVDYADVTVTGNVNTKVPGTYEVTYSYTDEYGNAATKTTTVTVVASQVSIDASDQTLNLGETWQPAAGFKTATDYAGGSVSFDQVQVDGTVDTTKPGAYQVTYQYTDENGNRASKTVTVTVKASQAELNVVDRELVAGPTTTWSAADNFVNATDAAGNPVSLNQVQVSGSVDPTQAGNYHVTYHYRDGFGNSFTNTVTVTVTASQAHLSLVSTTASVAQKGIWNPESLFIGGTDAAGNALTFKDITVSGSVDTSRAGTYTVTYSYTDVAGNVIRQLVTVTVTAEDTDTGTETPDTDNNGGDTDTSTETPDTDNNGGDTDTNTETPDTDNNGSDVDTDTNTETPATDNNGGDVDPDTDTGAPKTDDKTETSGMVANESTSAGDQLKAQPVKQSATKRTSKSAVSAKVVPAASVIRSSNTEATAKGLPQTNEPSSARAMIAGAVLLAASGVLAVLGLAADRRRN